MNTNEFAKYPKQEAQLCERFERWDATSKSRWGAKTIKKALDSKIFEKALDFALNSSPINSPLKLSK